MIAEGMSGQLKERVGGAAIAVVAADLHTIGEVVARATGTEPVVDHAAARVTAPALHTVDLDPR